MSKTLSISKGLEVIMDDDTYAIASRFSWYRAASGTVVTTVRCNNKHYRLPLHALVLGVTRTAAIGYRNANKLDVRRENLLPMSHQNQIRNQLKHSTYGKAATTSKYKGVSWAKREGRWRAVGRLDGKNIDIGFFDDEEAAAHAFDEFVRENYAPWGSVNFPQEGKGERAALAREIEDAV